MSHFDLVPLDYAENLRWREMLTKQCERESAYRKQITDMCREDILFWMSSLVWLFEPRKRMDKDGNRLPPRVPMIPWPHQIEPIRNIRDALGDCDIAIKKSRGEGASWIMVLMALHDWLFVDMVQVGLVSSKEKNVDIPNNLNTLFGKMDWELEQLPLWMTGVKDIDWKRAVNTHTFTHLKSKAAITGFAATADLASGARMLWFGLDELSKFPRPDDEAALTAVQQVTESRFVVATPWGSSGAYYEMIHEPSNMAVEILAWWDNPTRLPGLYTMKGHRPIAVDPETNPLHPDYDPPTKETVELFNRLRRKGYILTKGVRSPWFDRECDRPRATPISIAQELGMDFGGSQAAIFGDAAMQIMADTIEPEMIRGNLGYHPETLAWDWERIDDGECFLWCPLDSKGNPPDGRYVASADIAVGDGGSYTSNSVLTIVNVATREQVFEWTSNTTSPHDFACFSVAVCRWFHNAHLAWEQNGPGGPYSRQVLENIGYEDVFRRVVMTKRSRKRTKEYGWWTDQRSKEIMFADMITALKEGELIVRSKYIREEAIQYVRVGEYIRHGGYASKGLRDNQSHGDRVIAIAVGVQAMKDMPMQPKVTKKIEVKDLKEPPINSLAWRQKYFEKLAQKAKNGVDTRTLRDLMR